LSLLQALLFIQDDDDNDDDDDKLPIFLLIGMSHIKGLSLLVAVIVQRCFAVRNVIDYSSLSGSAMP
jgi:hypothetical protein